uniref:Putative secreted histamine binding protein n=1 Tax=Ixodes scapularis TaxID=6945 RepID=Q4PMF5_IXOSC|nr:putative secreted histamine binding protein [Ixodes scapularis]
MKAFFSLVIAALYPSVKCTLSSSSCECPAPETFLLQDHNYSRFRDPWPFLRSPERLYLKYAPILQYLENIKCIFSEFIKNDTRYEYVERTLSWISLGEQPSRKTITVELKGTIKSKSEVTATATGFGSHDFNTVYSDPKCLILRISQTEKNVPKRSCLLWVKEKSLKNPLRHCRFLFDVFCNWKREDLKPEKDCDKGVEKKDERPTIADNQNSGNNRPPR